MKAGRHTVCLFSLSMVKQQKMEIDNIEWIEVNVQSLAECLAKDAWEQETKGKAEEELYHYVTSQKDGQVSIVREVKEHWASQYFLLVEQYKLLILQFAKPIGNEDQGKATESGTHEGGVVQPGEEPDTLPCE